jgi:hypothetical protein
MSNRLLSLDAEQSCRLINETLAMHLDAIAAITTNGERPRRFPNPDKADREQLQRQATLIRLLAITESFSTERLHSEMDKIITPLGHNGARKMWMEAHQTAIMGWEKQKNAYRKWLEVPDSTWTELFVLTEARNAVAHGSGRLTWLQQQKHMTKPASLPDRLRTQKITLVGNRILLTEQSIKQAAETCTTFIKELDASLTAS